RRARNGRRARSELARSVRSAATAGRQRPAHGARHGMPPQTSTTPPLGFRNSDFCWRAVAWLRGLPCGSEPPKFGVFVVGGVGVPLSQTTYPEPPNGKLGIAGIP